MKAEICKTCIHNKLCMYDKNIIGMDFFVSPHPAFSTSEERKEAWEKFEKRKAEGFPCGDYLSMNVVEVVRCKHCLRCDYAELVDEYWCRGRRVDPDDFCSYGERRADEIN